MCKNCVGVVVVYPYSSCTILRSRSQTRGKKFFLENYVTSEGAVPHNDYYQQLPITRHQ